MASYRNVSLIIEKAYFVNTYSMTQSVHHLLHSSPYLKALKK